MPKNNIEPSALEELVTRLENKVNYGDGFEQLIAEDILQLAYAVQSELQEIKARLEKLEHGGIK